MKGRRFRYLLHNLIGHPLMELLHLVGARRAAWRVHQATLPREVRDSKGMQAIEAGEYFEGRRR